MNSEAKIIIAFLFKRSGKTGLTEAELYLPLSMELNWLSTKEAQEFVKSAIKQGLLVKKEGTFHPNFPLETVTIPLGFTPSKNLLSKKTTEQKEEHIINSIITSICTQTQKDQCDIQREIQQEGQEKNLLPEVAALYVSRRYNVDVTDWFNEVEQKIFKENTE